MHDTIDRLESGIAAYRARRRRRLNRAISTGPSDDGGEFVDDVPEEAWDLWQRKPADFREEYRDDMIVAEDRGYDDRNDDLSKLIVEAAEEGSIVDLGTGTYEMEHGVTTGSEVGMREVSNPDIIGMVGDDATIHYVGTELEVLFDIARVPTGVFVGVTFDISERTPTGFDSDVGIITGLFTDEFWAEDVRLSGRRNRFQDLDGDGTKESVGGIYAWKVHMTDPNAEGLVHRLELADGEVNHADIADPDKAEFAGTIPVATDPSHDGLIVYKDCHVERFTDNGFYMSYDPEPDETGRAVLWDCYAADVRGGCMRISENDTIVGGKSEMHNPHENRDGKALDVDRGENISVIGLEIDATNFGAEAIQVRTKAKELELDQVVLRTGADPNDSRPVRLSSGPDKDENGEELAPWDAEITVTDCHWYDESDTRSADIPAVEIRRANVTADNWNVLAEGTPEVYVHSSGSLTIDGETYGGEETYTASELGMDDPRSSPKYPFGD